MKKMFRKLLCLFAVLSVAVCGMSLNAFAEGDGRIFTESSAISNSYTYSRVNGGEKVVASPHTYLPSYTVNSESLGTALVNPQHITKMNGFIYIVNTGNNNIIITDEKFNVVKLLDSFSNNGEPDVFSAPEGCFVTSDGMLYVADTGNKRIVVLDKEYKLVSSITNPESDVLPDNFEFKPQKLAVDSSGRIFVVANGVYEGIMQFYSDGSFIGFVGSIPVTADPIELIWKKLLSREQNAKRQQFVPVTYTNLFLDSEEFMYTVSLSTDLSEPIRRLNPGGGDVLIRNSLVGIGVDGDQLGVTSQFEAICADENNIYYAADTRKNRLFIYDEDGNLLNVFGGTYTGQIGSFKKISALMLLGEDLLVLDSQTSSLTALSPTDYMNALKEGLKTYSTGDYEKSYECWEKVLKYNSNFELAYSKLGMIEIRSKNYSDAMKHFKLANDQKNYSKAYVKYRSIWYSENLSYIITAILAFVAAIIVIKIVRKKRKGVKSK